MLTWIKDAHWGWKSACGAAAGAGAMYGAMFAPLQEVERRLEIVEDQIRPVACWVEAQIRGTNPVICLVDTEDR